MFIKESYNNIISLVCRALNIDRETLKCMMEDTESKYMLTLVLSKYNCINESVIKNEFKIENIKLINKTAEEKLFVDSDFRNQYFELLKYINKENII